MADHPLAAQSGVSLAGCLQHNLAVLPDFLDRPRTVDSQHVEVRTPGDAVPAVDGGLV